MVKSPKVMKKHSTKARVKSTEFQICFTAEKMNRMGGKSEMGSGDIVCSYLCFDLWNIGTFTHMQFTRFLSAASAKSVLAQSQCNRVHLYSSSLISRKLTVFTPPPLNINNR